MLDFSSEDEGKITKKYMAKMTQRFDVDNLTEFKCIPNAKYFDDGVYVGL
jgi:hypothetical protein